MFVDYLGFRRAQGIDKHVGHEALPRFPFPNCGDAGIGDNSPNEQGVTACLLTADSNRELHNARVCDSAGDGAEGRGTEAAAGL